MEVPRSIKSQCRSAIRNLITSKEIIPGQIYTVSQFQKLLGVSATPIREAIFDLEARGLFEPLKNRGFRVRQLTDSDIAEISLLRELIEAPILSGLSGKLENRTKQDCVGYCDAMSNSLKTNDSGAFFDADFMYFDTLYDACGNQRAREYLGKLRDQCRLALPEIKQAKESFRSTIVWYHELLEALSQGNESEVARISQVVIENSTEQMR